MGAMLSSIKGHFYFKFDTATQEGERIYCVETNMYFDYRDKEDRQALDVE